MKYTNTGYPTNDSKLPILAFKSRYNEYFAGKLILSSLIAFLKLIDYIVIPVIQRFFYLTAALNVLGSIERVATKGSFTLFL